MIGFDRITFDSQIMGGRACVRGMRVTVSLILNLVATRLKLLPLSRQSQRELPQEN